MKEASTPYGHGGGLVSPVTGATGSTETSASGLVLARGERNQPAPGGECGGSRRPGAGRRAGSGGIPAAARSGDAHAGGRDGDHGRLPHPGAPAQSGRGTAGGLLVG